MDPSPKEALPPTSNLDALPQGVAERLNVDVFTDEPLYRETVARDFETFFASVETAGLGVYLHGCPTERTVASIRGTLDVTAVAKEEFLRDQAEKGGNQASKPTRFDLIRILEHLRCPMEESPPDNYGLYGRQSVLSHQIPRLKLATEEKYDQEIHADIARLQALAQQAGLELDDQYSNSELIEIEVFPAKVFISAKALETMANLKKDFSSFGTVTTLPTENPALWMMPVQAKNTPGQTPTHVVGFRIYNNGEVNGGFLQPLSSTPNNQAISHLPKVSRGAVEQFYRKHTHIMSEIHYEEGEFKLRGEDDDE